MLFYRPISIYIPVHAHRYIFLSTYTAYVYSYTYIVQHTYTAYTLPSKSIGMAKYIPVFVEYSKYEDESSE